MVDCIFCKIIKGEIPGKFVFKDNDFVVFHDINPKAPVHALVVPKQHVESLREVNETQVDLLGKMMLTTSKAAQKLNIANEGYKVVINNGKASGQLVFHLHLHLLGGWKEAAHWQV